MGKRQRLCFTSFVFMNFLFYARCVWRGLEMVIGLDLDL